MATLTTGQLAELREYVAARQRLPSQNWTKAQVNAAVQGLEDWFENTARADINQVFETAAPGVFSTAAKRLIAAYFLDRKAKREGVD